MLTTFTAKASQHELKPKGFPKGFIFIKKKKNKKNKDTWDFRKPLSAEI